MYRYPDPARDWDEWCKDHEDGPDEDQIPDEFKYRKCPECYEHCQLEDMLCGCGNDMEDVAIEIDFKAFFRHQAEARADFRAEQQESRKDYEQ